MNTYEYTYIHYSYNILLLNMIQKKKPRQIFFHLSPSLSFLPKSFNFLLVHPAPLGLAWSQGAAIL